MKPKQHIKQHILKTSYGWEVEVEVVDQGRHGVTYLYNGDLKYLEHNRIISLLPREGSSKQKEFLDKWRRQGLDFAYDTLDTTTTLKSVFRWLESGNIQ